MSQKITFVPITDVHEKIVFSWLEEPHVKEFWDNSEEHRADILNFIHGREQSYFNGTTKYYAGLIDNIAFAFLLADELRDSDELPEVMSEYKSKAGRTIFIDFCIGNKDYLGKGLGAKTLMGFTEFYSVLDKRVDTFFIDPDDHNPRAQHVYEKAGFKLVGDYLPKKGAFINKKTLLMVKKI